MQFSSAYKQLNPEQKKAVDTIDGPMLVIAGPGTGKTQLLSARVANILKQTDTLPQSILCLTFTDSATRNMRERLVNFIGQQAYDVFISTYHNFGSDIIRNYPEFFESSRLENPIDDLGKKQILSEIVASLPYSSPLKSTQYNIHNLVSTISELKRALMTPEKLREIAKANLQQIDAVSTDISRITQGVKRFPSKFAKAAPIFSEIVKVLENQSGELSELALTELKEALTEAENDDSSKPLTAWKNTWLYKNNQDVYVFTDRKLSSKLSELANVLEKYGSAIETRGLYDFDDMILKSIEAIKTNDELKFNLQEKYLYILLDEFQDTNAAQFEIVKLLSDNPVHEGRPNVMAVGDDDQAIYAFQGAEVSNMLSFTNTYRDVEVINLTKNYRSHHDILHVAHNIAGQIESRLHHSLENVEKTLEAASVELPEKANIARHEFIGASEEYAWIAEKISELVKSGVDPNEIALLSPRHKYLEAAVGFINDKNIPVTYEKRENILEAPVVYKLRLMVELVLAIQEQKNALINQLMPQVLSFDFYEIDVASIWQINWQHARRDESRSWMEIAASNEKLKNWVEFYIKLAARIPDNTLEGVLDILIGATPLKISDQEIFSPLKQHYFAPEKKDQLPLEYYETLSHLSVIREKLRDWQAANEKQLDIGQFIDFFNMYEEAGEPLINSHPIAQAKNSVKLMTVYKAKGLEFEHVFIIGCSDEVWGSKSKNNSNKVSLPLNMKYIRYAGADEDERKRLLFVAITRAKNNLYLTSHAMGDNGKETIRLKYFDEQEDESGKVKSRVLPESASEVLKTSQKSIAAKQASIELGWHIRHTQIEPKLKDLLSERLTKYQMSPTHLNSFTDLKYGGPESFLLNTLLRFPQAPSVSSAFGNAIHNTLDWYQKQIKSDNTPSITDVVDIFYEEIEASYVPYSELDLLKERGKTALEKYLAKRADMFKAENESEKSFKSEGVFVGDAHLSGKIDHMEIDKQNKLITVVDFKTGASYNKMKSDPKLHKYEQQLYCYKILIEKSHSYAGYKVESGRLEFVEPDEDGEINSIEIKFNDKKMEEIQALIQAVWKHIMALDLPDVSGYSDTMKDIKAFEDYLRQNA